MIKELNAANCNPDYIKQINDDPDFSNPAFSDNDEVIAAFQKADDKPNEHIFGVYDGDNELTGLFLFLISEEERYMELLVCLCREESAYRELFDYLQMNYPGFQADFVFNPENVLLKEILKEKDAYFDEEQQQMLLTDRPVFVDTSGIESLSEQYKEQYFAMHDTDRYWTGEKVAEAEERFNVYLAVDDGTVVGYLDITKCFDENEPFDIVVMKQHRRKGWGRKLMAAAIEGNRPKKMRLHVDVGNRPAIHLYESLGFEKVKGKNSQTVNWIIPE